MIGPQSRSLSKRLEVSQNFSKSRGSLYFEDWFNDTCVLLLWGQILLVASLFNIFLPIAIVQQSSFELIRRMHYLWYYISSAIKSLSFIVVLFDSLTRSHCMETFNGWAMTVMRKSTMAVKCGWIANQHLSNFDRKRDDVVQKEGSKLVIPLVCFLDPRMFDSISSECGQFS